jgi:signal transduction histidine kinase
MFHTIRRKFYTIAFVLVCSFGIVYLALAYYTNEQSQSAIRGREDVMIEREIRFLQNLFYEIRLWSIVVIFQEHPDADRKFGLLLGKIKSYLAALNRKPLDANIKSRIPKVGDYLSQYEADFNRIIQLKTQQRLNRTVFNSNYQSLASSVFRSNEPHLLKPLFNLAHFQSGYLAGHRQSEFQALKIVLGSLESKFFKAGLMDERLRDYIATYKNLLDQNYALEMEFRELNAHFEKTSAELMALMAQISRTAEIMLKNETQKAAVLRTHMSRSFIALSTVSSILLLITLTVLARKIVYPIQAMAEVMRDVKVGDIESRFNLAGNQRDEVVGLGRAFNEMLDTLNENNHQLVDYQKELEHKVQELAFHEAELESHRNHLEDLVEARTLELKKAIEKLREEIQRRKTVEAELTKHRNRLETMVEERTEDLKKAYHDLRTEMKERRLAEEERTNLEVQLQRAEKMKAIGMLAGGVAHDLNNILSGLVGYPELLLFDLPENSPLRKPIMTIKKSGERAATVVQDLLTLARRGVAVTESVDLNRIIQDYLKSPEYENLNFHFPQIYITSKLEENLLNIQGSPVHLSKTVMNLVSNAAEAMPAGGEIILSTENCYIDKPIKGYDDVQEGDYVTLQVCDTGVGISQEDLESIFEPFYTKKAMGRSGTGLGMAVVWGTVKDHKGYIDVESTEGRGTAFTLYFPVSRQERVEERVDLTIADYMGHGETVLVVDDVEEQREIACEMLSKLGYDVCSVAGGEEAVKYVNAKAVDLLILDMIMDPGIDGLETYKRILKIHPQQKAIIASGFSENESVKETQRLGAGAYVRKPYTLEKIGLTVRLELDK